MAENPTPPTPQPPEQPNQPQPPKPQPAATPAPAPAAQPSAAAPEQTPAPKKEEKPKKKGALMKKLAITLAALYVVTLIFIFVYAAVLAPINPAFDALLLTLAHIQFGILVGVSLLIALFGLLKSVMAKKDPIKKKAASKTALFGGIGFLVFALVWLFGVFYLSPRLIVEERFESYILTDPADPLGLTAPVEVEFDASEIPVDASAFRILAYTWDFGDGETGSGPVVTHRYTQKSPAGTYAVKMVLSYQDNKTGEQFTEEFSTVVGIENEEVAAIFTATPESGALPLEVEFNASSSYDPDGDIVAYDWDLDGDGSFDDGEGVIVDYTYEQEGEFTATLRVTDNNGEYGTTSLTIEAGSVGGLRAVINAPLQTDEYYKTEKKYEFSGELSQIKEGSVTKYVWDFDDGSSEVQSRTTSHTFDDPGEFEVSLTVYDADLNAHTAYENITVVAQGTPPSADIDTSPSVSNGVVSGPVPLEVTFDASGSSDPEDDIIQYEWDFENNGDIDDSGETSSFTYQEEGTYEARLIATDAAGNTNEVTVDIVVTEQGAVAKLEASVSNGEVPLTITFDASASTYKEGEIVSYEYDFGDGSDLFIGGSKVSYKYTDVGNFQVTITVIGDDGTEASTSTQVVVRPVEITACFTVNTDSGAAPLFVSVDPSCAKGTIKSYVWDFGDGEISFDRKPDTHTYTETGVHIITLEVTSDQGIVDVFELDLTVK